MKQLVYMMVALGVIAGVTRCGDGPKGGDLVQQISEREAKCLNEVVRGADGDLKAAGILIGMQMRQCVADAKKVEGFLQQF